MYASLTSQSFILLEQEQVSCPSTLVFLRNNRVKSSTTEVGFLPVGYKVGKVKPTDLVSFVSYPAVECGPGGAIFIIPIFCSAPLLPAFYASIALLQLQVRTHFYFQNEPTDYLIKIVLHT